MSRPIGACECGAEKWYFDMDDKRWTCGVCHVYAPTSSASAKPFRYRGTKRDYGRDPRYRRVLEAAEVARKERRITRAERDVANAIYSHQRRHRSHREKTQRVTFAELAAEAGTYRKTAQRAIPSLVKECGLQIVSPAAGNRNGAIYRFPARNEEA